MHSTVMTASSYSQLCKFKQNNMLYIIINGIPFSYVKCAILADYVIIKNLASYFRVIRVIPNTTGLLRVLFVHTFTTSRMKHDVRHTTHATRYNVLL